MSDKVIEVIADTLESMDGADYVAVAWGIVQELAASGFAVVELPEMVTDELGAQTWVVEQHWGGKQCGPGAVRIRSTDKRISATGVSNPHDVPADAGSLATALLAAANAAQGMNS